MANGYNAVTDSDGATHYIYAQDEPMSCALVCMACLNRKALAFLCLASIRLMLRMPCNST